MRRRALAGRLLFALALVVFAFVGAYVVTGLAAGDALGDDLRSGAAIERQRERLGLNQPLPVRLARRLSRLTVLDFGTSLRFNQPVRTLVVQRTATTMKAGGLALLVALLLGIPAGVLGSRARSPVIRHGIAAVSIALLSVPPLVVALVLAVVASGAGLPSYAVMVIALALPAAAVIERLQARAMAALQGETCLEAARARGVPRTAITWRHAWPLSLSGVLGVIGIVAGHLLSGALAIELVTSHSGLGLLTFDALMARDLDLVAGCAAAAALIVGLSTLAADLVQMWTDPRSAA
jgi:peptide/nickel transport system permease protein